MTNLTAARRSTARFNTTRDRAAWFANVEALVIAAGVDASYVSGFPFDGMDTPSMAARDIVREHA